MWQAVQKKIVIVDDEAGICSVLNRFFTEKGYMVFVSHEAGEGISIIRKEKPYAAIVDIKMPGMNGIELLKVAREIDKKMKVIMISAIKDDYVLKEAYRLGATAYLTKPFKLEEINEILSRKEGNA